MDEKSHKICHLWNWVEGKISYIIVPLLYVLCIIETYEVNAILKNFLNDKIMYDLHFHWISMPIST